MPPIDPASAIVVRVPLPRPLTRLRSRSDSAAGVGVPAHVTVLFPFLPADRLGPDDRRVIAAIAAAQEPFDVQFGRVGRFPGVVYLEPEPSAPFSRLTEAIVARYPQYLPYGGTHDVVIPHLTIMERADGPLEEIAREAERSLPFTHHASALEVLVEGDDQRWRARWRLPLGIRR